MELRGRRINFLGDGITQGVGVSSEGRRFPDLIVRQTAPSWPPEMDRHFMTRLDEIPLDADAIVVFGGTNDFGHGDAPWACSPTAWRAPSTAHCTCWTCTRPPACSRGWRRTA